MGSSAAGCCPRWRLSGFKSSLLVVSPSLRRSKATNSWKSDLHSSPSVLPDPHAGSGEPHPGRYDGELHQHLPAGGHAGTVEGTGRSPERIALVPLALFTFPPLALVLSASGGVADGSAGSHRGRSGATSL